MATRDFDAMLAEKAGVRPTFTVAGQTFTARAKVPFKKFTRMLAAIDDDADVVDTAEKLFDLALIKADRQRFQDLLDADGDDEGDEDAVVSLAQLNQITEWLMEIYTGKPQTSTNSSSPGPSETGPSSNVVSLTPRTQTG
ncbi:MAG: hypothetical protein M3N52_11790 [Actinomycetota bacterium]|nr:hypothetical protein [Actinomycetota bacterium]